jgi:hypothetical protein
MAIVDAPITCVPVVATVSENAAGILVGRIPANTREAYREKTWATKALKVLTGVSVLDIEKV